MDKRQTIRARLEKARGLPKEQQVRWAKTIKALEDELYYLDAAEEDRPWSPKEAERLLKQENDEIAGRWGARTHYTLRRHPELDAKMQRASCLVDAAYKAANRPRYLLALKKYREAHLDVIRAFELGRIPAGFVEIPWDDDEFLRIFGEPERQARMEGKA